MRLSPEERDSRLIEAIRINTLAIPEIERLSESLGAYALARRCNHSDSVQLLCLLRGCLSNSFVCLSKVAPVWLTYDDGLNEPTGLPLSFDEEQALRLIAHAGPISPETPAGQLAAMAEACFTAINTPL